MAYTVAQLAQRSTQSIAWLFVIEGIPYMWTDTLALEGSGPGSWIDDYNGDAWTVLPGLRMPDSVDEPDLDLDTGMLTGGDLSITIDDTAGVLITLLREQDDHDFIGERLAPTDDPAPATLVGIGGDSVPVWGRFIGPEAIGPAGERRRFQIPGATLPGYDHVAVDAGEQTIAFTAVTDAPEWLDGRRCALYRIWQDPITGVYAPLADQLASGYSRTWWGTVPRPTESEALEFTLACEGPPAWLARTCNQTNPEAWGPVSANLALDSTPGQRDDLIAVAFQYVMPFDFGDNLRCGFSSFDPVDDTLTTDQNAIQVINEIRVRMSTLVATAGADATFSTHRNGEFKFELNGASVRVDDDNPTLAGVMQLCMHEKVWRFLGYDPQIQDCDYADTETPRDINFIECTDNTFQPWPGDQVATPGPGYWVAYFTTLPIGATYNDTNADNDGNWRTYKPVNPAGITALYPEGGQEIALAYGLGPYCGGQLARPVADHVMENGQPCDRTGFFALRGNYRDSVDADARMLYQVIKGSWVNDAGTFADDGEGNRTVVIERWLDPRLFGYPDPPIDRVWSSENIEWAALSVIGYNTNAVDRADLALLRLMLSTGTKQWDAGSYEGVPGATYEVGANGHPDAVAPHLQGDDQDSADISVAIPHQFIDWRSFINAAKALPDGGYLDPLNTGKVAFRTGFDSAQAIEQIMRPRGWAMVLDGYRYGLTALGAVLDTEDATVTIGEADIDKDAQPYIPPVTFDALAPYDRVSIEYGYPAAGEGGDGSVTFEARALSSKLRARHNPNVKSFEGFGMTNAALWAGEDNDKSPPHWVPSFRKLHCDTLAEHHAAPHEYLPGVPIKIPKANDLNVGTVVLVTTPWPATRTGAYGMVGRVGRIVKLSRDRDTLTATCDIQVQAGDANTKRRFAPIARVLDSVSTLEERHDADHRTLYCYGDWFEHEGGSDVRRFAEPAWSTLGGNATIVGMQYNGREWIERFTCDVESVDTTAHTITYVDGSFTGSFREREYCVLQLDTYDNQTAPWPKAAFVVNTDPSGKFGGVKGFELQ